MRGQKLKNDGSAGDPELRPNWRDDIAADVFELWIGISRLMARVHGPERSASTALPAVRRRGAAQRSRRSRT